MGRLRGHVRVCYQVHTLEVAMNNTIWIFDSDGIAHAAIVNDCGELVTACGQRISVAAVASGWDHTCGTCGIEHLAELADTNRDDAVAA
jgi:hypothetical protein